MLKVEIPAGFQILEKILTKPISAFSKSNGSKDEEKENISKLPCEFCSEPQEIEYLMKHQVSHLDYPKATPNIPSDVWQICYLINYN